MLLGYDQEGNIKFIFTDEEYLESKYPNNSAKINNFWKFEHGLKEFFISVEIFKDWENYSNYKIIDGKLTLKENNKLDRTPANTKSIEITKNTTNLNNQTIIINKGE